MEETCYAYYDAKDRIIGCIKTRFPSRILSLLKLATSSEVTMKTMDFADGDCNTKCPYHMDRVRTDSIIDDYDEKQKLKATINAGFDKIKDLAMSENFEAIRRQGV